MQHITQAVNGTQKGTDFSVPLILTSNSLVLEVNSVISVANLLDFAASDAHKTYYRGVQTGGAVRAETWASKHREDFCRQRKPCELRRGA